jgi:hypothetical protein
MKTGTKSVLIGAHQIIIHTITVFLAWCELYGFPNWKEFICILLHDIGYVGLSNIDGWEGVRHPDYSAAFIAGLFGEQIQKTESGSEPYIFTGTYSQLVLYHSRNAAARFNATPSKLCWADKLSVKYDPWWLYLPRVIISGEIEEFRELANQFGEIPLSKTNREWYRWAQARMIRKAYSQDARIAYKEGS